MCYETSQAARKTNFLANKLFSRVRCRTQLLFLGPIPARDFGCAPPPPCTVCPLSVFSGPAISCIMHESAGVLAGMKTNTAKVVGYERQEGSQPRGQWLRKYPRVQQVVVAKTLSYNAPPFLVEQSSWWCATIGLPIKLFFRRKKFRFKRFRQHAYGRPIVLNLVAHKRNLGRMSEISCPCSQPHDTLMPMSMVIDKSIQ